MKQRLIWFGERLIAVTLLLSWAGTDLIGQDDSSDIAAIDFFETWQEDPVSEDYLYFDLGCNAGAWSGYFAPKRWRRVVEDKAIVSLAATRMNHDKGDVPSIIFAEGREHTENWSIEIPAAGYLSFCLQPTPLVNQATVSVSINDNETDYQVRSDGLYYSPFLQRGDVFSLQIPAGTAVYYWSKLVFHSNFNAVIVRPQAATIEQKFVPIIEGNIQRVFFPSDAPGTWPVFDQDGDRSTVFDQQELRSSNEIFEVEYTDNQIFTERTFTLERTFIIREKCSRANWLKRNRAWCTLPLIVE
ncbi:hypothetical protein [Neolewinella persica]|uniref:hypothetical protein n=1 Tax=Neolewinella persica TaxID=70998 RepID=UPI000366B9C5|nr:hypothetical protein [Neolewinella persica]